MRSYTDLKTHFVNLALFAILVAAAPRAFARELTDTTQTKVQLGDHPVRIVPLAPSLAELAADIAGEDLTRIVGVTEYTDYPAALEKRPSVGPYYRFSIERVAGLKPDLVLATFDGNNKDQVNHLRELGLPVVVVATGTFDEIENSMKLVAAAMGDPSRGEQMAAKFHQGILDLRAKSRGRPKRRVLLQVGDQPLIVAGGQSYLNEAIETIGATNVYGSMKMRYPRPSLEDVITRDPESIVILALGKDLKPFYQMERRWAGFPLLSAIKSKQVRILKRIRSSDRRFGCSTGSSNWRELFMNNAATASGSPTSVRTWKIYALAAFAWVTVFVAALKLGVSGDPNINIIYYLRLPRALLASAVGAGLAVSGAALQAMFANPLCEPYTLGISSGSALGAVIGASLGLEWVYSGLAGTAFIGALVFTVILFFIARKLGHGVTALLLSGVMLGFFGSSMVALWMALSDVGGLVSALLWLLGDLSRARLKGASFTLGFVLLLSGLVWYRSRDLDAMLIGEEEALSVGVDVTRSRRGLIVLVSLLVASCVGAAGMVGFVGLIVPHFARRSVGSLHTRLIPLCALMGAAVLTGADVIARVAASPVELPVGVVTALVGAPLFVWIITASKGGVR